MTPAAWIPLLTAWLAGTDLANLELEGPDGLRLHLVRAPQGTAAAGTVLCLADEAAASTTAPQAAAVDGTTLRAGAAGVLRRVHPLQTAPLVQPGQAVQAGQVLALLQLGSLLLPVCAPCAATVEAWCCDDGQPVEWGQALLRWRPLVAEPPDAASDPVLSLADPRAPGAPTA
jgi:acetyl-CoA carboxylase biotin carboxyl carrier protein